MDNKQKKRLITFSLAGAVLLAGLVAGFLVVQNGVFIQNKASEGPISCVPILGTCEVAIGSVPYKVEVKVQESDGSTRVIASSTGTVTFPADPLKTYICEVVSSANAECKATTQKNAPLCVAAEGPTETPKTPTEPPLIPKTNDTATPTPPAKLSIPSTTATPVITTTSTIHSPTVTAKPTSTTATSTPAAGSPTSSSVGGNGITPTGLPTNAPTATAAAQATKAAATTTQAAVQTQASNPSATKTASSTSLPASGNVHPALIFGMLSVFIIVLGLLF